MNKHLVPTRAHHGKGIGNTAEHPIFIADILGLQPHDPVATLMPPGDAIVILLRILEISEARMLEPLSHGAQHRRSGGKPHIGHPHGDDVKPFAHNGVDRAQRATGNRSGCIRGNRIVSHAIDNVREIEHSALPPEFHSGRYGHFAIWHDLI